MADARLIPFHVRADINATLARLRIARAVHPAHEVLPGKPHTGCDICTAERRLDWLLSQIPRTAPQPLENAT